MTVTAPSETILVRELGVDHGTTIIRQHRIASKSDCTPKNFYKYSLYEGEYAVYTFTCSQPVSNNHQNFGRNTTAEWQQQHNTSHDDPTCGPIFCPSFISFGVSSQTVILSTRSPSAKSIGAKSSTSSTSSSRLSPSCPSSSCSSMI